MIEANENLENILYSMPYGILIVDDITHKIIDVNPQALLMIGLPAESVIGKECHEFVCPSKKGNCPISDMGMQIESAKKELITSDGHIIPILKTVLQTQINDHNCLLELFIDISDQEKAESARVAKEKLRGLIEVAGAICHEMNQPLMIISSLAELMLMKLSDKDNIYRELNTIMEQIDRMGEITKKLMSLTSYKTKKYLDGKIVDLDSSSAM